MKGAAFLLRGDSGEAWRLVLGCHTMSSAFEESFGKLKNVFSSSSGVEPLEEEPQNVDDSDEKGFFTESVKTVR